MSKSPGVEQKVRIGHCLEANRRHVLALGHGVAMMVPEEMQARLHGREHFVDGRLARVLTRSSGNGRAAS